MDESGQGAWLPHRVGRSGNSARGHPLVRSCAANVVSVSDRAQSKLVALRRGRIWAAPNCGPPSENTSSTTSFFTISCPLTAFRTRAYRLAIERAVRGKSVVDIGTGGDLGSHGWCLDAGARRVFALEMLDGAYEQASRLARELNAHDRLVLIHGDARKIRAARKSGCLRVGVNWYNRFL